MEIRLDITDHRMIPNGIAAITIFYYFPERPILFAPFFLWQTRDYYPTFPRTARYLRHWITSIDANIESIVINHELLRKPIIGTPKDLLPYLH